LVKFGFELPQFCLPLGRNLIGGPEGIPKVFMMWGDRINSVMVPDKEVLWWWRDGFGCDGFGCTKTEADCFFNLELAPRAQRVLISNLKKLVQRGI